MAEDNLIDVACDRIKFDKDKLESNELARIEVDSFMLSDFWAQFGTAVQALSNEVTKVGFMCGKKPYPTIGEVGGMLCDVMQYYSMMRDLYLVLPEEVGEELFKAVTAAVLSIMSSLLELVRSLKDLSENGAKKRLTLTGTFWDACKAVEALPRDSLQEILKVYEETALATEVQQELTAGGSGGKKELAPDSADKQEAATEELTALNLECNPEEAAKAPINQSAESILPIEEAPKRKCRRGRRRTMRIFFPDGSFTRINVNKIGHTSYAEMAKKLERRKMANKQIADTD